MKKVEKVTRYFKILIAPATEYSAPAQKVFEVRKNKYDNKEHIDITYDVMQIIEKLGITMGTLKYRDYHNIYDIHYYPYPVYHNNHFTGDCWYQGESPVTVTIKEFTGTAPDDYESITIRYEREINVPPVKCGIKEYIIGEWCCYDLKVIVVTDSNYTAQDRDKWESDYNSLILLCEINPDLIICTRKNIISCYGEYLQAESLDEFAWEMSNKYINELGVLNTRERVVTCKREDF